MFGGVHFSTSLGFTPLWKSPSCVWFYEFFGHRHQPHWRLLRARFGLPTHPLGRAGALQISVALGCWSPVSASWPGLFSAWVSFGWPPRRSSGNRQRSQTQIERQERHQNGGAGNPGGSWTRAAATVSAGGDPTGSKNALKGVGFSSAVCLPPASGFSAAVAAHAGGLLLTLARHPGGCAAAEIRRMSRKPAFLKLFSTSAGINRFCRCPFSFSLVPARGGSCGNDPGAGRSWRWRFMGLWVIGRISFQAAAPTCDGPGASGGPPGPASSAVRERLLTPFQP